MECMAKKLDVDANFFKTWSHEMAYVLGFFLADGTFDITKRGGYYFGFNITDKEILYLIRKMLGSKHKISERPARPRESKSYRLQIGDKEMCEDLLSLGVSPRKTFQLSVPKIPVQFVFDFVRGYFDGDGNVWCGYINKKRKRSTFVIQITFTSGSATYLKSLKCLLNENGIDGGALYVPAGENYARLTFSTTSAVALAEEMYRRKTPLSLKRKKRKIYMNISKWQSINKI